MNKQIEKQIETMKARIREIEAELASAKLGTMDSYNHGELNGEVATLRRTIAQIQTIIDFC